MNSCKNSPPEEEEDLILSQESFLRLENFLHNVSKTKNISGRVVSLSRKFNMLREAIDGVNLNRCSSVEKQTAIILHPLPRNNEISTDIDEDPRAVYFQQVKYGVKMRMALLDAIINKKN